ncbi:hypothetical protein [Rubritalea halochordaticola]
MNPSFHIQNLHFTPSMPMFITGIVALILVAALCVTALRRSSRPKITGLLEGIRFLITLIVVLMLWEPEWRTVIHPEDEPKIAVLWDASGSTSTEDALVPEAMDPDTPVISRKEWIEKALDEKYWKPLEADNKTTVFTESFSAIPEDAEADQKAVSGSDLNSPLEKVLEQHDNLRAVVMISDGDWNLGAPPVSGAQKLLINKVPLFTIPVGSQKRLPDLDLINVTAPTYGIIGENVQIPFTVRSSLDRDVNTVARLRDTKTGQERTKSIRIPAGKEYHDSILWRLESEGSSTLELSIPFVDGELVAKNNMREFIISGKKENLKVLVIESTPRWEYRFIRNALSRDPGVDVDCLLFHPQLGNGDGPDYIQRFPEKLEDLQKYDVVFLGDVGVGNGQLTIEQADLLKGLVENQASGIVFIPGSNGYQESLLKTPLGDLIPVILDKDRPKGISESTASPLALTGEGRGSLLTMLGNSEDENEQIWRDLPGFYWSAAVLKAKGGADVLATHANRRNQYGRIPLLVTKTAGTGKVLFLGHDSAWRWRRGVEDLYHYRFWGQVARWMSYQRNMAAGERVRLYYTPDRPNPGDYVTLNANAFDQYGAPLKDGSVYIDIQSPDGKTNRMTLNESKGSWGAYSGRFRVTLPGEWKLTAGIAGTDAKPVVTNLIAQGQELEKTGQPARPEVLAEMAKIANGQMLTPDQIPEIASIIDALPQRTPLETRVPLWAQLTTMIILIVLMSIFWVGRKLNGTF